MSMTATKPTTVEIDGSVATIVLNRPDRANALDFELVEALQADIAAVAKDDSVRAVLITGTGSAFCAGGDVSVFAAGASPGEVLADLADAFHTLVRAVVSLRKPVGTLVNGAAAGAGLSLAILGDFAIAARGASFLAAYGTLGLTPDGGMSWMLPRLVGLRQAQQIMLGGARIDAAEAARIGLVSRLVEPDELHASGLETARRLASGPIETIAATRDLLLSGWQAGFFEQLDNEARSIAQRGDSREGAEGIGAYLARRRPTFQET